MCVDTQGGWVARTCQKQVPSPDTFVRPHVHTPSSLCQHSHSLCSLKFKSKLAGLRLRRRVTRVASALMCRWTLCPWTSCQSTLDARWVCRACKEGCAAGWLLPLRPAGCCFSLAPLSLPRLLVCLCACLTHPPTLHALSHPLLHPASVCLLPSSVRPTTIPKHHYVPPPPPPPWPTPTLPQTCTTHPASSSLSPHGTFHH